MKRIILAPLALLALTAPLSAGDGNPKEQRCSWIYQTPEGKFRFEPRYEWSLLQSTRDPAAPPLPANVVNISCLRDPPVLVPGDLAQLKQGRTLSFGTMDQGLTIVRYTLADGKLSYEVTSGGLGEKNRKKVEKAMAAVQRLVEVSEKK